MKHRKQLQKADYYELRAKLSDIELLQLRHAAQLLRHIEQRDRLIAAAFPGVGAVATVAWNDETCEIEVDVNEA